MKITIKDVLRIILALSCATATQIKAASCLDQTKQKLYANEQKLQQLYLRACSNRTRILNFKKPTKKVHFSSIANVRKISAKSTLDLILEYGFTKSIKRLCPYTGKTYLQNKPNVSTKLIQLLERGHSLYLFKRNLRHIPTQEIIRSLESYLRCNRNEELTELLGVLKTGNYYEV